MNREDFLYESFLGSLGYPPTSCQDSLLREVAHFCCSDDGDIMVVNGYAGTGKTTAVAGIVSTLSSLGMEIILLAPTGRSAKVLSSYTSRPAYTIHKHIYRRSSIGEDGMGRFSLGWNKARGALFVVDEVSLIGIGAEGGTPFGSGDLLSDLVSFVRNGCGNRLILVGDSAQLPPIGHSLSPALDEGFMKDAGGVTFCTLSTVVRQASDSGILRNATVLRELISDPDFVDMDPLDVGLSTRGLRDVERITGGELIDKIGEAYSRYGEDDTIILCRSNKRALTYNMGIRSRILYNEEQLVRGERIMVVKNCYNFTSDKDSEDGSSVSGIPYIANGDMARLVRISHYEERYGLHFADARLVFPDYEDEEVVSKVCLDALSSNAPSLTQQQQNDLYRGVWEDYSDIPTKKKRMDKVKEDPFYNALQIKYALALTCHKAQGGQWRCVFVDNPFWTETLSLDDLKWLYTALTRAVEKVYLVNFKDELFAMDE